MPFKKGHSGNPGGRPKGLSAAVRAHVGEDGTQLVKGWYLIAFGAQAAVNKFFGGNVKVSLKDRLQAMSELSDHGFGKAPQAIEVSGADGGPLRHLIKHNYAAIPPDAR